jgi:hypothetical protein
LEGAQHPDRDAQFRCINDTARAYLDQGLPVVSVDTKKKELIGRYANGGVEWQPVGEPERVNVHDFPDPAVGKAIPYGVYDLGANAGWVPVGTDHDTAAFAVATLRRWWQQAGQALYPNADRLLVTADAGGSNGYRVQAWKTELARFAADTGLEVTVCHFPPGTSKTLEQGRTPAVQPHLDELAGAAADLPRGHRGPDRRDHVLPAIRHEHRTSLQMDMGTSDGPDRTLG